MIRIDNTDKGKAIRSTRKIPKGTVISIFTGKPIDYKETLELDEKESFALQQGSDSYLLLDEPYCYYNHSCEPNCGLNMQLELFALTDIADGTELRYDYSTTMLERHWTMPCSCGAPSCRKIIKDFDTLPAELQERYIRLGIVQRFILDVIGK